MSLVAPLPPLFEHFASWRERLFSFGRFSHHIWLFNLMCRWPAFRHLPPTSSVYTRCSFLLSSIYGILSLRRAKPLHTNHQFHPTLPLLVHLAQTTMSVQASDICYSIVLHHESVDSFQCISDQQAHQSASHAISSADASMR
jgi:hypothetical protein